MDATSAGAFVNYYRCSACLHVWALDKQDPSKVTHVTPLPPKPPRQ
jgi:hypothetical protein